MAPEPQDVYWPNLEIPYRQLWFRKMGTIVASTAFIILFLYPVSFVQVLAQLEEIEKTYIFASTNSISILGRTSEEVNIVMIELCGLCIIFGNFCITHLLVLHG